MSTQPPISAAPMGLFPTMGSLQEVVDYADSQLPIKSKNDLLTVLFIYQNTLLMLLKSQQKKT